MARVKLSEFAAKRVLYNFFNTKYHGISINSPKEVSKLSKDKAWVIKVDEGIKKRFKQGLVKLNINSDEALKTVNEWQQKGYSSFIAEEYVEHEQDLERYLAFERTRLGIIIYYSLNGGVDIESQAESVKKTIIKSFEDVQQVAKEIGIDEEKLSKFVEAMDIYYFSFLEINPLLVYSDKFVFLDIAAEVDSAAEFFAQEWSASDFKDSKTQKLTDEEKEILKLSLKSASSFKLDVLNPNGSVFMLLSGGGISVVLADEMANLKRGQDLANYGEYSGNPTEDETYIYAKNVLSLLLKSNSSKKVLIIGGGVANFTDVRITFRGIIKALDEVKDELVKNNVKVFVRRGGPHQKEGLENMKSYLSKNNLMGIVSGPEMIVSDVVKEALKTI